MAVVLRRTVWPAHFDAAWRDDCGDSVEDRLDRELEALGVRGGAAEEKDSFECLMIQSAA